MSQVVEVAKLSELSSDGRLVIEFSGTTIAIFKVGDKMFGVADFCPHAGHTLHDGDQVGETVACLLHGATFDLATGKCVAGVSCEDINAYEVFVGADEIVQLRIE